MLDDEPMTPERIATKLLHAMTHSAGDDRTYYFAYVVDDSATAITIIATALQTTAKHAAMAERNRIRREVLAIQADYPADVFPSREGQAARHVAERVLRVLDGLDATHPQTS